MKRKTTQKELTLKEKKLVIEDREKGLSERALAEKHSVSKSQIHRILQNKENILRQPEKSDKRRRLNRKYCAEIRH